jgi:hypothetical protein
MGVHVIGGEQPAVTTTRGGMGGGRCGTGRQQQLQQLPVDWQVNTSASVATGPPAVSTWSIMLAVWPLEERPDEMRRPEVVNSLTFDQMVTYKKLYDARMKKEGKGEEVFGRDCPIPPTMFEAAADDCAEQLHPAR